MLLAVAAAAPVPGRAEAAQKRPHWWAPSRTWWARLLSDTDPELLVEMSRQPEVRSAGFKMWMKMVDEPGTWLTVSVQPVKVKSVVFTPKTKMVVTTKDGRVVESERFLFWPDQLQTELYESAKRPVVVSLNAVCRGPGGSGPSGL